MSSNSVFDNDDNPLDPLDPFADHGGQTPAPAAARHRAPEVHEILAEAVELIETARPAPLSTAVKIEAEPLLDLLDDAIRLLPQELREARWLLRERTEYLESVRREGDEIIAIARSRAERMVERTEVAKSAEQRAQRIIADAEAQSRHMQRETEDFCDARLASLQGILDRTRTVVVTGRSRLQGTAPSELNEQAEPEVIDLRSPVFDQDFS